jgi:hypothetical protein
MRFFFFLLGASAILACGGGGSSADAGDATTSDVEVDCGATFICCSACDDDTRKKSICVDGKPQCPAGMKQPSEWVCPCYAMSCSLPPYHASCISCDGGPAAPSTCDVDANVFVCPAGMHSVDDLDAACE